MQIRTGALSPMASVDDPEWQELPKVNIYRNNRVAMNYYVREMEMVDLFLKPGYIMTGDYFSYLKKFQLQISFRSSNI